MCSFVKSLEKRAVKVGWFAWKAKRGRNTMGIVLPLLRHSFNCKVVLMKFVISILAAMILSGCTIVVTEVVHSPPHQCSTTSIPVYGYADIYRHDGVLIRIKEVTSATQQWRCN
jgi:hypothetical protein